METFHKKWQEMLNKVKDAKDLSFFLGFQPLTKRPLENSGKAGGNATEIPAFDSPLFVITI